jgi:hypothetical protein
MMGCAVHVMGDVRAGWKRSGGPVAGLNRIF